MCGINGIAFWDQDQETIKKQLLFMRDTMIYRGPDDCGIYLDGHIGLGHRRLSILDLSNNGRQPMASDNGQYQIVFNGEIYNYLELQESLKARGHKFKSSSDTEVLLKGYIEFGEEVLAKLNGMFAFAIWDAKDKRLFLARDRLGEKPLYYALCEKKFLFASEEKALFASGVPSELDREILDELFYFRYVSGEKTVYRNIKRLLPGHYLIWEPKKPIRISRWWSLSQRVSELRERPPIHSETWFRETFDHAVKLRCISDVPVGVLLSGGLDSGNVAASLGAQGVSDITCFTVRFKEPYYDEGPLAYQVAQKWGMPLSELYVAAEDMASLLKESIFFTDSPIVHHSEAHLLAIARFAKRRVSVLLSGEGGDETLCGYVRYQPLIYPNVLKFIQSISPFLDFGSKLNNRFLKLKRFSHLKNSSEWVFYNSLNFFPEDLGLSKHLHFEQFQYRHQIFKEASLLYPHEPVRQAMYYDHHTHLCSLLDRNDRMTMAASIECRVPFLDHRLVENLAALPTKTLIGLRGKKKFLRKYLGDRLPHSVKRARKWGFGIPWAHYLRTHKEWHPLLQKLPEKAVILFPFLSTVPLKTIVDNFLKGDLKHEWVIRQLMTILLWQEAKKMESR